MFFRRNTRERDERPVGLEVGDPVRYCPSTVVLTPKKENQQPSRDALARRGEVVLIAEGRIWVEWHGSTIQMDYPLDVVGRLIELDREAVSA